MARRRRKRGGGRQPSQNTVIDLLAQIAALKGYRATLRKKVRRKQGDDEEELLGTFRPDLVLKPAIGVRGEAKVIEVEATVNNQTICKSVFSLLDHMTKERGAKGFLVVPRSRRQFAEDKVKSVSQILRRFQGNGPGRKRDIGLNVLTFDDVRTYYKRLTDYENGGRVGQPPKFVRFDA